MADSSKCGGDGDGASRSKINPWALQFQKLGLELKCPSCLELLNRPTSLPCDHVFCGSCIRTAPHFRVECVVCKATFANRDVRPLPFMENIVGIYKSLEANFCSNLFQPISSDVRTILGQNPVSPNTSSAGKMPEEPFDHAHGGKSNSGQSLFSSSRVPCSLNQSVADVVDNNDTVNKYGMPIDANGNEQELARRGGIGDNGLGNANSSVPNSQVGVWGLGECMKMERGMIQVAQTLPDSPPSFGDAKCSDNDSCDRRCEQISENSLVRRSISKTGDVRTGQKRHDSTATATDSHLRDAKRQKNMNQAPVSGTSSELEHKFVSPSDESFRNRSICAFCQSSTISEFTGPMLHYSNEKSVVGEEATASNVIHVHRICIDWAPQVYFVGENVKQLKSEVARGAKLKCSKCGLKGAALGCFMKSCRRSYHVTCAIGISKCRWDKEDFLLLCPSHRSIKFPSEKLPLEKSSPEKPKICPLTNSWVASNGDKELILCPSGLSAEEKLLLTKFATMSGASVVKLWRPDVTHVIAAMDDDGAYVRTFKTCMAIVSGRWILTIDWVKACMETMHHVDEEPYEFSLDNYGYCNAPKTGRLRGLNNDPKLFRGLNFYFAGDFELERKEDLQDIIIAAGGTFSNSTEEVLVWSSQAASRTLVVYNLDPPEDCQLGEEVTILWQRSNEAQDIAARIGSQIIGHMWLLESVSRCELQPIIC